MADWTANLPKPDYRSDDGSVVLYCADCMDILPQLPDGVVDAVVTDIPYGEVNRKTGGLRNLDKSIADVVTVPHKTIASESARLSSGSVYIWCGIEQVSDLRSTLVDCSQTTRLCGWEKTNPSPMNGDKLWLSSFECCVFGRHSRAWFDRHCASPIWRGPIQRDQQHPTQKPLWLMDELVTASVPPRGRAIDFFMGSGTTGVACVKTGRKFIGIELSRKYFDIAVKRIENAFADQGLFTGKVRGEKQSEIFA